MRRGQWLAAGLGVSLVGFALRAYLLDGQSLWYDEGTSAAMAPRGFQAITAAAAADIHPPLYYYLLHIWTGIAGTGEYALRFPSVVFGVLLLPLLAVVGRRLFGPTVGLLAAWLGATSVLLVYYSQEARMYALLLLLGTLVIYIALRLPEARHAWPWALALGVAVVLSLYTHYLAAGPIALAVLFLLASPGGRVRWAWWMRAMAAALAAWAPWAVASLGQVAGRTGPAMGESVAVGDYLARVTAVFAYGLSFDATLTGRAWALVIVLAVAALWWAVPRRIPGGEQHSEHVPLPLPGRGRHGPPEDEVLATASRSPRCLRHSRRGEE
ncbi:MAG: glycosyltransferase family 39 protein, partial [Chloroflexi bacterium]|nr:glycosyltransferase family 39 protein [Chloroflexota bacterium]